jgi:hypothetical protein
MTAPLHARYQAVITCDIVKSDDDKRLVTGIVLQPNVEDLHGDTVSAEVIEQAAHAFVAKYNAASELGVQHKLFGLPDVHLAESYIAPEDTTIGGQPVLKGTWIMTVKVLDDALWKGVKDGSLTGFSIGATATVPAETDEQPVAKAALPIVVEKSRPLLHLDVHEVSLVDAAANDRKFLITKSLVQDASKELPMTVKPTFVTEFLVKDLGKIKLLSKELAMERLTGAAAAIETLKANFEGFTDVGQLWKAVDDIHGMLWPVEGDIHTAVFKSLNEGDHDLAVSTDVSAAISAVISLVKEADEAASASALADSINVESVSKYLTAQVEALKAKSVTPKRLAALGNLAQGLIDTIAEMSPAVEEETEDAEVTKSTGPSLADIAALLDSKLAPVTKRLDELETQPEATEAEIAKAKEDASVVALQKAKDDLEASQTATADLKKKLEELEAGSADDGEADDTPDPDTTSVKKSLFHNIVHQPTRKQREAGRANAARK